MPLVPAGRHRTPGKLRIPGWLLAGAAYLGLSVGVWWQAWSTHPASAMTCACGDPASFAWFLAWPAYAITYGQSLFFTTHVHVPAGINLLANTGVLALGVPLAPVTWLFGPVATLNVALTAAPALSALAAYACLRRALGLARTAAFTGGLLFGFSSFVMRNESIAHLQVSFLALVPLIFWCCYQLAVTQHGSWRRWGLALGLALAAQFFVGTEMLTITAVTTGLGLLAAAVAALSQPGVLAAKLPFAWRGFALAAAVAGVLLAYPAWFALHGPQHISGPVWHHLSANGLGRVLLPLPQSEFLHELPKVGYLGPPGTFLGYLGIPALAALALAVVINRRPLLMLFAGLTVAAVWLSLGADQLRMSLGGEPSWLWLPWRLLDGLPVLDKISPANFSAAAAWFVAAGAAFLLDHVLRWRPAGAVSAGPLPVVLAGAVAAALVVPVLFAWPLPLTVTRVSTPAWVTRAGSRLPGDAVVLFYPFPSSWQDQALVWQAEQGMRYSVAGGRGIVPGEDGTADHDATPGTPEGTMTALSTWYARHAHLKRPPMPGPAAVRSFRAALRRWRVTTVVMTGGGRDPGYARRWLTAALGAPPSLEAGAWTWNRVRQLAQRQGEPP